MTIILLIGLIILGILSLMIDDKEFNEWDKNKEK